MIKFFRKIRQDLLSEGKTGKYLKYAFGEVVLVVIGILIALQINNWNQLKQYKSELSSHLNTTLENITDDEIQLMELIEFREKIAVTSKKIINAQINNENLDIRESMAAFTNVTLEKRFDRYRSGFDQLEKAQLYQSNDLKELRELIAEYDKIIEEITFWEFRFNSFTEEMEKELYIEGFFQPLMPVFFNVKPSVENYEELTNEEFRDLVEKYPSVSSIFFRVVVSSSHILNKYKQLIEKGESIKSTIKVHLSEL